MAAWARPKATSSGVIIGMGDSGELGTAGLISLWDSTDTAAGQPVEKSSGGSDSNTAFATTTYTADTWNHFAVVHDSNGGVSAYLNGGNKGTDTTNTLVPFTVNRAIIGGRKSGAINVDQQVEASIAWAAVWDTDLTDAEVAMLGAGAHPILIRPSNLVLCLDLVDAPVNLIDRISSATWERSNTISREPSPPIFMPSAQILQFPPGIGAPAGSYTIYDNYYRQLMAGSSNV